MSRDAWMGIAVLALVALAASGWLATHDRVIDHQWSDAHPATRRDPYLAARLWTTRLGLASDELEALERADALPPGTLLVVPALRFALSPRALAATRAFVERGGHLLVESEPYVRSDPLFDAFGIDRAAAEHEHDDDAVEYWSWRELPPLRPNAPDTTGLLEARVGPDATPLRVYLHGGESLSAPTTAWQVGADANVQALHFALGRGRVTAVSDIRFLHNTQIGRDDNAEFLWRLLQLDPAAERVVFHRGVRPGLFAWLLRHAWPVLAALGALIALIVWHAAPRFGPPVPDPAPVRRRLLDHLGASGRYFWGAGRRAALACAAADAALAAARRQYPHMALLPDTERAAFLAMRYGIAPAAAARLLAPAALRSAPALIETTQACARIHAAVAAASANTPGSTSRTAPSRKPSA